jgi:hypothetical protein
MSMVMKLEGQGGRGAGVSGGNSAAHKKKSKKNVQVDAQLDEKRGRRESLLCRAKHLLLLAIIVPHCLEAAAHVV